MPAVSVQAAAEATEIDGQVSTGEDRFVRPVTRINGQRISFGDLARFAWPRKTDVFLSDLTGCDARTCRRWLAGHNEPPAEALGVILGEIMRRFHMR